MNPIANQNKWWYGDFPLYREEVSVHVILGKRWKEARKEGGGGGKGRKNEEWSMESWSKKGKIWGEKKKKEGRTRNDQWKVEIKWVKYMPSAKNGKKNKRVGNISKLWRTRDILSVGGGGGWFLDKNIRIRIHLSLDPNPASECGSGFIY
jgi:hypothetical protein